MASVHRVHDLAESGGRGQILIENRFCVTRVLCAVRGRAGRVKRAQCATDMTFRPRLWHPCQSNLPCLGLSEPPPRAANAVALRSPAPWHVGHFTDSRIEIHDLTQR